jgi:hypothetical protein
VRQIALPNFGQNAHVDMAHIISFRTRKFDVTTETPNPINPIAGQSVLKWLRPELAKAQYTATEPDTEDWGWYLDVTGNDGSYLVGASADADGSTPDVEWVIQVHKHRSMKDKLLGRNTLAVDDSLAALIERILRADPHISDVAVERET